MDAGTISVCMTENCPICTENTTRDWNSYDAVELVYYGKFVFGIQTPMYAFYQYLPDGGYAAAYVPAVPITGDTPLRHIAVVDHR